MAAVWKNGSLSKLNYAASLLSVLIELDVTDLRICSLACLTNFDAVLLVNINTSTITLDNCFR